MKGIREPSGIYLHFEAIGWINALMIDLKLRISGQEPTAPMTMERLDAFGAHYENLMCCRKPATTSRYDTRTIPSHDVERRTV